MADPSPLDHTALDRAKQGDAGAIAHLLNQVLRPKGITARGNRQGDCLLLWLESEILPEQTWVVRTIEQGMQRLCVESIRRVRIQCESIQRFGQGWSDEIRLHNTVTDTIPLTATPAPSFQSSTPASGHHAQLNDPSSQPISSPEAVNTQVDEMTIAIERLLELMRSRGLQAKARLHQSHLQIRVEPGSARKPNRVTAIIYTLLERHELAALNPVTLSEVQVYGMASPQKVGWKAKVPLPPLEPSNSSDHRDLLSFRNRYINLFGFPILMLLGIGMNTVPLIEMVLLGIKIWFHEFGHAIIAWLGGYQAIPLPYGWTSVSSDRSLFVYFGLLFLFGLMYWAGRREQKRWPMVLAGVLIGLQFCITWLLPEPRFQSLLAFGGVGGELYLCTLLMVSFYFPLPAYWRWEFYRYPVVLGAAFTFWGQVWLWRQIKRGLESIPWGGMWGDPDDGDMNRLSLAGWSDPQIIGTYSALADFCLIVLLGVYFYYGIQQNRHYLFALLQRWMAQGS